MPYTGDSLPSDFDEPKPLPPEERAALFDKPQFSVDEINRGVTAYTKKFNKRPSVMLIGPRERAALDGFDGSVSYSREYDGTPENPFEKFHRLLKVGIFCMGSMVMRLDVEERHPSRLLAFHDDDQKSLVIYGLS